MNDELEKLSDDQLSEVFAMEVEGMRPYKDGFWHSAPPLRSIVQLPSFATSADAVLPFLNGKPYGVVQGVHNCPINKVAVIIYTGSIQTDHQAIAPTLARAACIALIRAKRAQK